MTVTYSHAPAAMLARAISEIARMPSHKAHTIAEAFPRGSLSRADAAALQAAGCTEKQAAALVAAVSLAGLLDNGANDREGGAARQPRDVAHMVRRRIGAAEEEHFVVLLLDSRQRVIRFREVSIGSLAQVDVHPRELFRDAIRLAAHSVILAHNHPSGDPDPSEADVELTHRMAEVGRLVGIPVLDHLVVTRDHHVSLAALGLVPSR